LAGVLSAQPPASPPAAAAPGEVRRLAVLFGAVYFAQGICQVVLLLNQPLKNYLRKGLGFSTDEIAAFMYVVMIPWMLKPLYGLLSDFLPIAGYRRKTYLLLMNLLAAGAFFWAAGISEPRMLSILLLVTALGVACSDVVIDALMVESGQRTGRTKLFQGVQWTCISVAVIGSAYLGGQLTQRLQPHPAFRVATLICAFTAAAVAIVAWLLVREAKSRLDLTQLRATARGIGSAFLSLRLWLVLAFLMLTHFKPGLQTPLYIHVTETLRFTEEQYGTLNAIAGVGYAVGAAAYTLLVAPRFSTRGGIAIGLVAITIGSLSYLLMRDLTSARIVSFVYGVGYMLSGLALLGLAAEACPKRAEGFTFAAIMAASNFAMQASDYVGSLLYERVTHKQFWPLAVASAGIMFLSLALVPFLPKPSTPDPT
jgi:MFS family permease